MFGRPKSGPGSQSTSALQLCVPWRCANEEFLKSFHVHHSGGLSWAISQCEDHMIIGVAVAFDMWKKRGQQVIERPIGLFRMVAMAIGSIPFAHDPTAVATKPASWSAKAALFQGWILYSHSSDWWTAQLLETLCQSDHLKEKQICCILQSVKRMVQCSHSPIHWIWWLKDPFDHLQWPGIPLEMAKGCWLPAPLCLMSMPPSWLWSVNLSLHLGPKMVHVLQRKLATCSGFSRETSLATAWC